MKKFRTFSEFFTFSKWAPTLTVISGGVLGFGCEHQIGWMVGMASAGMAISGFATLIYACDGEYKRK